MGCSGVSCDGGNIWKTASPVLNKLDDLCRQIVPLQYFGFFFNRKCERIAVTFATSFGIERKLKVDFVGEDKKGNRIKMVEISFLSNDSVILEQFLSLALSLVVKCF